MRCKCAECQSNEWREKVNEVCAAGLDSDSGHDNNDPGDLSTEISVCSPVPDPDSDPDPAGSGIRLKILKEQVKQLKEEAVTENEKSKE